MGRYASAECSTSALDPYLATTENRGTFSPAHSSAYSTSTTYDKCIRYGSFCADFVTVRQYFVALHNSSCVIAFHRSRR